MPRRYLLILLLIQMFTNPAWAVEYDLNTGVHFSSWQSDDKDKGTQLYIPIQLETEYRDVTIGLHNACVYAKADSSATGDHSFVHFIDTKVNLTYKQLSKWNWEFLIGFDLNLPTGKTGMNHEGQELLQDPDLNDISRFGEGFNLNPTISAVKEWDKIAAGMGLGYAFRGEYDYNSSAKDFDPGDLINLTAEMLYDVNPLWRTRAFCEYVHFGKDQLSSDDFYQNGAYFLLGFGVRYTVPTWHISSTLQHINRSKGKILDSSGSGLTSEEHNGNGDEWIFNIDYKHSLKHESDIFVAGEFMSASKNDYDSNSVFFTGKRQKLACTVGLTKPFKSKRVKKVYIKAFQVNLDHTIYQPEDRTYHGLALGIDIGHNF